jgi:hypothetical protein
MSSNSPTRKQLSYLRTLSERAGQSFVVPRTQREASAEIRRLTAASGSGFTFAECAGETCHLAHGDVAIVHPWELSGRGSTATWSQRS